MKWPSLTVDDHSRGGFSLMLADEKTARDCAFLLIARRYYKTLGVQIERVMTDNGSAYKPGASQLLRRVHIKHVEARPSHVRHYRQGERFILAENFRYSPWLK